MSVICGLFFMFALINCFFFFLFLHLLVFLLSLHFVTHESSVLLPLTLPPPLCLRGPTVTCPQRGSLSVPCPG